MLWKLVSFKELDLSTRWFFIFLRYIRTIKIFFQNFNDHLMEFMKYVLRESESNHGSVVYTGWAKK